MRQSHFFFMPEGRPLYYSLDGNRFSLRGGALSNDHSLFPDGRRCCLERAVAKPNFSKCEC